MQAGLGANDRLPPERELTERLRVGRSTIREALRHLEGMGLIERRAGSGTFLTRALDHDSVHVQLTLSMRQVELLNGLEIRRALELEAVSLAAARATSTQLQEIEALLLEMEAIHARTGSGPPHIDVQFHRAIYQATGNPLFPQIIGSLNDVFATFFTNPLAQAGFAERSFDFHRPLFEAIRDGDAAAARTHITAILDVVEDDLRSAT